MGKEINRGIYKLGFLEIWLWGKKKRIRAKGADRPWRVKKCLNMK